MSKPVKPVTVSELRFGSPEYLGGVSSTYIARPAKDEGAEVVERDSGKVVRTIVPGTSRQIAGIIVDDDWVSWSDLDEGASRMTTEIFVARLPDGPARSIEDLPGAFAPGLPDRYDRVGPTLAYATQDGQRTNCVPEYDLRTERGRVVSCTPRRAMGTGMPQLTPHGLVFSVWNPDPEPDGCTHLMGERGGELVRLPAARPCVSTSGIDGGDFWVWSEQRSSVLEFADIMGADASGARYRLGRGNTSTEVLCGDWAYWLAVEGNQTELRRWRPGESVEALYRTPKHGVLALYGLTCDDGRLHAAQPLEPPVREDYLEFAPLS